MKNIIKLFRYRTGELDITMIKENLVTVRYGLLCDKLNFNSIKGFGTFMMLAFLSNFVIGLLTDFVTTKDLNKDYRYFINYMIL